MAQMLEAVQHLERLDFPNSDDLPAEDGIPLETNWHRIQMNLLIDIIHQRWRERDDYFVGGNMFIYYSSEQARNRDYKGPDFFLVKGVDGSYSREKWVVWEEGWRYPDVIVELMSPSTAEIDLTTKKELYARTFHTANYFAYDPWNKRLHGWHNASRPNGYEALQPDENGWLWSRELEAWIGLWRGRYQKVDTTWLRLFDVDGRLILTQGEAEAQRAEAEAQRAEAEAQRAEAAEAEAERLRAELARLRRGG